MPHPSLPLPNDSFQSSTFRKSINHEEVDSHPTSPTDTSLSSLRTRVDYSTRIEQSAIGTCSQNMAIHLGESEDTYHHFEDESSHIILAHVKSALQHCNQTLTCNTCRLLSDPMMLAAVLVNKVVSVLESISFIFSRRRRASHSEINKTDSKDRLQISVGDYTIDSEMEWTAVMEVLGTILLSQNREGANSAINRSLKVVADHC